jgi:hypothetical protein
MQTPDLDTWRAAAEKLGPNTQNPLRVPYPVAIDEATGAAGFVNKYWTPQNGLPGLNRVEERLPLQTAADLLSILRAVQQAQTRYLLITDPNVVKHGERANFLIKKLEGVLGFTLDDGIQEPADEQLAQIQDFHSQDSQRSSALAQALQDYGALATQLKPRIALADKEFPLALIDEALTLAEALRQKAEQDASRADEAKAMLLIRNQLLSLMMQRLSLIRRTADYVFEDHPQVVREVTSDYERRRRNAARLRAKQEAEEAAKKVAG